MRRLVLSLVGACGLCGLAAVELPYWYEVEYIEAYGQQYVDTEIVPGTNVETRVGYQYLQPVDKSIRLDMIGGARSTSDGKTRYYPASLNGSLTQERYVFGTQTLTEAFAAATRHEVVFNDGQRRVWLDGRELGTLTDPLTGCTKTMLVFAANSEKGPDWFACARVWHYDIWKGREPVRSLIPVVDKKGEACFYDRVSNRLFRNAGTGTLTAGPIAVPCVKIDLSGRTDLDQADQMRILAFNAAPAATTSFELDPQTAKYYFLVLRWDGVYLMNRLRWSSFRSAKTATWIGAAKDGNPENPDNWLCRDAKCSRMTHKLPCETTTICVTGETSLQAPPDKNLAFASLKLSGTIRLMSDCDWRGFGWIVLPRDVKLELNGHRLLTTRLSRYADGYSTVDVKVEDLK